MIKYNIPLLCIYVHIHKKTIQCGRFYTRNSKPELSKKNKDGHGKKARFFLKKAEHLIFKKKISPPYTKQYFLQYNLVIFLLQKKINSVKYQKLFF